MVAFVYFILHTLTAIYFTTLFVVEIRNNCLTKQHTDTVLQVVYGTATARARWRECEHYVTGQMGMAVGQKFVKQEFDETAKDSVGFSLIHK